MERLELEIDGMSCGHCTKAVRDALEGIPGVTLEQVEIGTAALTFDPDAVTPDEIAGAVEEEGYTVRRTVRSQPGAGG